MQTNEQGERFAAWLLEQTSRNDCIGPLEISARRPKVPTAMVPDDLCKKLQEAGAQGGRK